MLIHLMAVYLHGVCVVWGHTSTKHIVSIFSLYELALCWNNFKRDHDDDDDDDDDNNVYVDVNNNK